MPHKDPKKRKECLYRWRKKNPDYWKKWAARNAVKLREAAKRWRDKNPDAKPANKRSSTLKFKYGITEADYQAMLQGQDGKCAICGQPPIKRQLCVDHNHQTNAIRGLLCRNCNMGIGYLQDNSALLRAAAQYLDRQDEE